MPGPVRPAGTPQPVAVLTDGTLQRSGIQESREAVQEGLGIASLDAGAPNRIEPLFWTIPGRDLPEMRIDGFPVGPIGWPETSPLPLPMIAIEEAVLCRYTPIAGPLSATGGPRIDVTLVRPTPTQAISTIRLTQGSYGTFTDEIELRRPFGPVGFRGYYGDTKSDGRYAWGHQFGQTIGLRVAHPLGAGWWEWGVDDAFYRSNFLSTKRALWDRKACTGRYTRRDSLGPSFEAGWIWQWIRGAYDTSLGRTERKGRFLRLLATTELPRGGSRYSATVEAEGAALHYAAVDASPRYREEFSFGLAAGWQRDGDRLSPRLSVGVVRLAPLQLAPVFSAEVDLTLTGWPRFSLHSERSVRNRTLPRLPSDGMAWVRQGIDLAVEEDEEEPEGLWQVGLATDVAAGEWLTVRAGLDLLETTRGLEPLADLGPLGIDGADTLSSLSQRGRSSFVSPWVAGALELPAGFRVRVASSGAVAEGGVDHHLGLPALRWRGELAWIGALFRRDLLLDLILRTEGRSVVETPYGRVAPIGTVDGEITGSIGSVSLFFVLANLTNVEQNSLAYDGGFVLHPLRNYRAGIRWSFLD